MNHKTQRVSKQNNKIEDKDDKDDESHSLSGFHINWLFPIELNSLDNFVSLCWNFASG